jgi:hypothetical protein
MLHAILYSCLPPITLHKVSFMFSRSRRMHKHRIDALHGIQDGFDLMVEFVRSHHNHENKICIYQQE